MPQSSKSQKFNLCFTSSPPVYRDTGSAGTRHEHHITDQQADQGAADDASDSSAHHRHDLHLVNGCDVNPIRRRSHQQDDRQKGYSGIFIFGACCIIRCNRSLLSILTKKKHRLRAEACVKRERQQIKIQRPASLTARCSVFCPPVIKCRAFRCIANAGTHRVLPSLRENEENLCCKPDVRLCRLWDEWLSRLTHASSSCVHMFTLCQ